MFKPPQPLLDVRESLEHVLSTADKNFQRPEKFGRGPSIDDNKRCRTPKIIMHFWRKESERPRCNLIKRSIWDPRQLGRNPM
jgi:hypothetical protein